MRNELLIAFLGYILVSTCILVDLKIKAQLWKEILWASFLSCVQLVGVAFLILVLVKAGVEVLNLALVPLFFLNGARIARNRIKGKRYRKIGSLFIIFFSMLSVSSFILFLYWLFGILTLKANSIIPLSGIIAAAGMRSLSLAFNQYAMLLRDQEEVILGMFALGATETTVSLYLLRDVVRGVATPMIDTLKASGVVHIPGVMVGLLVAGILPLKAAAIQFVILVSVILVFITIPTLTLLLLIKFYGFYLGM